MRDDNGKEWELHEYKMLFVCLILFVLWLVLPISIYLLTVWLYDLSPAMNVLLILFVTFPAWLIILIPRKRYYI